MSFGESEDRGMPDHGGYDDLGWPTRTTKRKPDPRITPDPEYYSDREKNPDDPINPETEF